jgi:hypothetical protein
MNYLDKDTRESLILLYNILDADDLTDDMILDITVSKMTDMFSGAVKDASIAKARKDYLNETYLYVRG